MFSSARLFAFVFFFLFFLSCILISRLIFTTFSFGNMLSFFFYVIIYCWSYLFTFIFHAESVGVYVHFDFLCWYLAFFDQLIIIVLCSFDSKQIPRNKKKCCSQSFFFKYFYFWMLDARRCLRCRERGEGGRRRLLTRPEFLMRSPSLQWFPLIPKSGIISIQMKPGAEPAQHYHLPIDDYANSYTVHRCNERERGKKKKGTGGENGY